MIKTPESSTSSLINAGILNIEDLEINKLGHISDRQKGMLFMGLFLWLLVAVFETLFMAMFIYVQFFLQKNVLMGIAGIGLLITLVSLCLKNARPNWDDIRDGKPKSASGTIFKHSSIGVGLPYTKGSWIGYSNIRIGNQVFPISPTAYGHIEQGKSYRVYYLQKTRKIINIEPL